MPGSPQSQLAVEVPSERRRPTSLFERFTGVSRAKPQQSQPQQAAQPQPTPEQSASEDLDMLEIPAFLRRGG